MENREFVWYEKYQPKTIDECVLPQRLKDSLKFSVSKGEIQSQIFHGPSGIGKTTVAKAMCQEAGVQYMMINASRDRGIDTFRTTVSEFASTVSLEGNYKVVILDEADGLSQDAQDALRGISTEFSENCKFILTCNHINKITDALKSRFPCMEFSVHKDEVKPLMVEFFKVCVNLLKTENIVFENSVVAEVIQKNFPDFRGILGKLQHMQTEGGINLATLNKSSKSREYEKLIPWLKSKDYDTMAEWVFTEADVETSTFRTIYDALAPKVTQLSKPALILITSKYQVQSTMAVDQAINMVAYLAELMVELEFND